MFQVIGKVMSSIKVHHIHKINELLAIFYHLSKISNTDQNESSKKLVIVDSLSVLCALISTSELNPILSNFVSVCRFLVNHLRAVVIIVNTLRLEGGGRLLIEDDKSSSMDAKPSLGNYWLCIPNVRLLITHLQNTKREISVWKSCQLENGTKCLVNIKDEGICSD